MATFPAAGPDPARAGGACCATRIKPSAPASDETVIVDDLPVADLGTTAASSSYKTRAACCCVSLGD